MSTHLEIVVAKAKPVMPIFIFIKSIFNIIFNIFAKAVAIIGVLVSLVDLRQLDKIKDKHKNIYKVDMNQNENKVYKSNSSNNRDCEFV